jgi:hypothetical protein
VTTAVTVAVRASGPPVVGGRELVGLDGLEPSTSSLSGMRSNRLSYSPRCAAEPHTPGKVTATCGATANRPDAASLRFPQRYFDPTHEVRRQVVNDRTDRGEGGNKEHIEDPEKRRIAENRRRGEVVRHVHAGRPLA